MSYLPAEIIHDEILHKLPAKALVRFKCVSKSFYALISSTKFIDLHLRQSFSHDTNSLLIFKGLHDNNIYSFDIDSPSSAIKIPLPNTLDKLRGSISIVGSCNGLLCLSTRIYENGRFEYGQHILMNPSTGVHRLIPHKYTPRVSTQEKASFGFGFDDLNGDYKIVSVYENAVHHYPYLAAVRETMYNPYFSFLASVRETMYNRFVMVYSLKDDSWKSADFVKNSSSHSLKMNQNCVVMNIHLLHWVLSGSNHTYRICCFDVRYDKWVDDVPLMDIITHQQNCYDNGVTIGILYGCLCLSTVTRITTVWMMKEYGVKEAWVKLLEIHNLSGLNNFNFNGLLGFRQGSKRKILAQNYGRFGLFWCNIDSENNCRIEEIKGVPSFYKAYFCKGSLVQIPGGHKIVASTEEHGMKRCRTSYHFL